MINYMDDNVTWIGAQQNQFIRGKENLMDNFEKLNKQMKSCDLLNQHFCVAHNSYNSCTIVGRYIIVPEKEEKISFQMQQRCTYIWEIKKGEPKIACVHISCPVGQMSVYEDEVFPNKIGSMNCDYIKNEIDKIKKDQKALLFYDIKGNLRFIYMEDVVYAESNKRTVIVHTACETIEIKFKWSDFLSITKNKLILVHRNYVVNKDYVVLINSNSIKMKNGEFIPIPTKKSVEVKAKFIKLFEDTAN